MIVGLGSARTSCSSGIYKVNVKDCPEFDYLFKDDNKLTLSTPNSGIKPTPKNTSDNFKHLNGNLEEKEFVNNINSILKQTSSLKAFTKDNDEGSNSATPLGYKSKTNTCACGCGGICKCLNKRKKYICFNLATSPTGLNLIISSVVNKYFIALFISI
jgi:hypothetical protein